MDSSNNLFVFINHSFGHFESFRKWSLSLADGYGAMGRSLYQEVTRYVFERTLSGNDIQVWLYDVHGPLCDIFDGKVDSIGFEGRFNGYSGLLLATWDRDAERFTVSSHT